MKILHTADIHLREYNDERWDALSRIIELGESEKIDILIISGDLFDANIDAIKLKQKIRELFSKIAFKIFIIPGNHDSKSYEDGSYLGPTVEFINSLNRIYEFENVRICGLPFEDKDQTAVFETLNSISRSLDSNKYNILLYHGELLDSFYSRSDFGDEGSKRYMPVKLDFLKTTNFDYILAGHFHTNFNVWDYDEKRYFVYPGSPVSITRRETGRRGVNIFTAGDAPNEVYLDTPFYEEVNIKLDPFSDIDPITEINTMLDEIDINATVLLSVDGYLNRIKHGVDEKMLNETIENIAKDRRSLIINRIECDDFSSLLEDEIFRSFKKRLDDKDFSDPTKNKMIEHFLRAMKGAGL